MPIESSLPKAQAAFWLKLAENFNKGKTFYSDINELREVSKLNDEQLLESLHRLNTVGAAVFDGHFPHVCLTVVPLIIEYAVQIRNQPKPDYWKQTIEWFTSRKWTLPIVVIIVATPIIQAWVEIVKNIFDWLK